jgi:hypothetical protein
MRVQCASPLSEVVPSCKIDGGVGDHDIGEGPAREVKLHGGFLVASFPHPQQLHICVCHMTRRMPSKEKEESELTTYGSCLLPL